MAGTDLSNLGGAIGKFLGTQPLPAQAPQDQAPPEPAHGLIDTIDQFLGKGGPAGAVPSLDNFGAIKGQVEKIKTDGHGLQGDAKALQDDQARAKELTDKLQKDQANDTGLGQLNPTKGPLGVFGLLLGPVGAAINVGSNVGGNLGQTKQDAADLAKVLHQTKADAGKLHDDSETVSHDLSALEAERQKLPFSGSSAPKILQDADTAIAAGQFATAKAIETSDQIKTVADDGLKVTDDIDSNNLFAVKGDAETAKAAAAAIDPNVVKQAADKAASAQEAVQNDLKSPGSFVPHGLPTGAPPAPPTADQIVKSDADAAWQKIDHLFGG